MAIQEITAEVLPVTVPSQDTASFQNNSDVSSKEWYEKLPQQNLLRYLLLGKIFRWAFSPCPVKTLGSSEHPALSSGRPVYRAKKRLGVLIRCLLAFTPSWIQKLLGFLPMDPLGTNPISQDTLETLVNPSSKRNKRKHEDLILEEHQSWVETLHEELPDEDDPEDPTYEPSKSLETDSEEYRSQNDTETDLEFEEKDGVLMLKENLNQGDAPSADDKLGETQADAKEEKTFLNSADGSEHPINQALDSATGQSVTLKNQAEKSEKDDQIQENLVEGGCGDADITASTDSQEQWVEVSGE